MAPIWPIIIADPITTNQLPKPGGWINLQNKIKSGNKKGEESTIKLTFSKFVKYR